MARRGRRRRGRRAYTGLGGYLRGLPAGFTMLLLASAIMALGAAVANALSGNLSYTFTVGTSSVTLDLGFIPGLVTVFAGLFLFLKGLRQVTRTKI